MSTYPYNVILTDPAVKAEATALAMKLRNMPEEFKKQLHELMAQREKLNNQIWEVLNRDPAIDIDRYIYRMTAEDPIRVTCEGAKDKDDSAASMLGRFFNAFEETLL